MVRLKIGLLGSYRVSLGDSPVTQFESNKVRALLAYLAVESDQPHSREKLADLLWPEMPAKRANPNLSRALYDLRQQIRDYEAEPPYLIRSREAVQFNPDSDFWLDVKAFIDIINGNGKLDPALKELDDGQLKRLQAVIDLYRGEFLAGFTFEGSLDFDDWVRVVRQRLQRQALGALHQLVEYYVERGETAQALLFAWRQVELDPLDEAGCRQLMSLLAASNQRSQALSQFKRLQVILAEELAVAPEAATLELYDRICGDGGSPKQLSDHRDNLPALLTPLVGRQRELAELLAQCTNPDCRLLTILGPGGSGKTRLALEVARTSRAHFTHGVCFVALNPLQSTESILPAVVEALDLPRGEKDDHQTLLSNYLREKHLLLVLDGYEHLLASVAALAELLHKAPGLKLLVTSRTRLNLKGEQLYPLSGMRYPQDSPSPAEILRADAVQLLITGLQRALPGYQPLPADLKHLLQICRQVQGMPLAILLAASWGATMSLAEIAGEVSRGLDFLAADWADVPARQRSLRATYDHTWKLLAERERSIFQSLSVFRGTFSRAAARAVSSASPHELRALVERSLLWNNSPGWYEVHELLRQYGREQLARADELEKEVCDRHSAYYLDQLSHLGAELKSARQPAALHSIDLEHENYRAAWNWAARQAAAAQLSTVVDALCLYYDLSTRYPDGESACRVALEGLQQNPADGDLRLLQAHLSTWQSRFTRLLGQPEVASHLMENALNHLEEAKAAGCQVKKVEAFIHLEQGNTYFHKDRAAAAACYQQGLEIYNSLDDIWGGAKTLARLGLLAHHSGSFQEAVKRYTESLELFKAIGDPRGTANALVHLGHNTQRQGQASAGLEFVEDGIKILQQIGDRAGVARGYLDMGRTCFYTGQFAKGNGLFLKSLPILEDLGMHSELVYSTVIVNLGFAHNGEYSLAIAQAKKGLPLAQEADARREIAAAFCILGIAYLGQGDIEQTQAWALKSIAQYQEIDQKDELGWALALMAFVERDLDQARFAESYLCQALEIGIKTHGYFSVLHGLCAAALLFLDQGEIERAVGLYALVTRFPVAANSRWFEDVVGREIAAAAKTLPPEVVAVAQERGRGRDLWETAEELLEEVSEKTF